MVSLPKTKFMVVGCGVTDDNRLPLPWKMVVQWNVSESVPLFGLLDSREWLVP